MEYFILVEFSICLMLSFTRVVVRANERPTYRSDYMYEKAFDAFYKVHHAAASWHVARVRCEAEGTALLVPESLDEADSMPVLTANVLTRYRGVFVGMHDLYSEKSFVTINGSALADSILELLWEKLEPQHKGGRCVAMRRSGRLYAHDCDSALPFVCKTKTVDLTYQANCDVYESPDKSWTQAPNGQCYMSHPEPQTWSDAYATCLASGGHLAILNNRSEADYVRDLFKRLGERRIPENDFAFLGFSDLFQRHHFRTVHGDRLEDTGYADWDIQCAQDSGNLATTRRCGGMRRSGLLSTGDCRTPAAFFCEKSGVNSTKRRSNVPNIAAYHHYREKLLKLDKKTYFVF